MEMEGSIDDVEAPTREDITDAIRKLKNNKAAGIDNIAAELIKNDYEFIADIIGDYQAGFRRNPDTADQIFTIRQALENYWEFNKNSYHLFIDFKQAYDSVHGPS
ncbi:uncharacterized protein [Palaemon carinicauda]|uniref:uncharacterized protein n=1 Tax=Palaemon carinicauda TaxID=392227 RepID=UPI0035B5E77C